MCVNIFIAVESRF